jgi:hypothetical protein
VTQLAAIEQDIEAALEAVASELGALNTPPARVAELSTFPPQWSDLAGRRGRSPRGAAARKRHRRR